MPQTLADLLPGLDSLFSEGEDPVWERRGIFLINRVTGERKLQPIAGGLLTETSPERSTGAFRGAVARGTLVSAAEGIGQMSDLARQATAVLPGGRDPLVQYGLNAGLEAIGYPESRQRIREGYEASQQRIADVAPGPVGPSARSGDPGVTGQLVANVAGEALLNLIPAERAIGAAGRVARGLRGLETLFDDSVRGALSAVAREARPAAAASQQVPRVAEAMAHAGSDVSPEAISRVQSGVKFYRIRRSGEVQPILNDVAAVDVRVNPGEAKVRVGPDGSLSVEQGQLGNQAMLDASRRLASKAPEAPAAPRDAAKSRGVREEAERFLAELGDKERRLINSVRKPLEIQIGPGGKPKLNRPPETQFERDFVQRTILSAQLGAIKPGSVAKMPPNVALRAERAAPGPSMGPPDLDFQYKVAGRLDVPEESIPEIVEIFQKNAEAVAEQRRAGVGGIAGKSVESMANRLGLTPETFLQTKPGTTFNQEELAVLDGYVSAAGRKVDALRQQLGERALRGDLSDSERLQWVASLSEYEALLKTSAGASSEIARALRSRQDAVQALSYPEQWRRMIAARYAKLSDKEAFAKLMAIPPGDEAALAQVVRMLDRPGFWDLTREAFYANILSRPVSHLRNMLGNTASAVVENLALRPARGVISPWVARATRTMHEEALGEVPSAWMGALTGIKDGTVKALRSVLGREAVDTTASKFTLGERRSAWLEHPNAAVRKIGKVLTLPLKALTIEDDFFRTISATAELHARAARTTRGNPDKMAELLASPTNEMLQAANRRAAIDTFNDPPSMLTKAILFAQKHHATLGFVVPFARIADRLLARGAQMTPYGLARGASLIKQARRLAGTEAQAAATEATDVLARAAIGSMVMTSLGIAAVEGKIKLHGQAPRTAADRERFYQGGQQAWSIEVGGRIIPYSQLEPLGFPLAIAAMAAQAFADGPEGSEPLGESEQEDASVAVGRYLLDKSYMSTLADTHEAIIYDDPELLSRTLGRIGSGFIPASGLLDTAARMSDPRLVEIHSATDVIRSQVPGLRQGLPSRLSRFGEEIVPAGGGARALAPLMPTRVTSDPVETLLSEAGVQIGFTGNKLDGVELTREQAHRYQELAGQETKRRLQSILDVVERLGRPELARSSSKLIERRVREAREWAKYQMWKEYPETRPDRQGGR